MALKTALLPPAIKPTILFGEVPKVGGHSAASSIPSLPLVPAPIKNILEPLENASKNISNQSL